MLNNFVFTFLQAEHIPACVQISSTFKDCWKAPAFENVLVSKNHFCFVALQEGKAVGFACFLVLDNEINLEMVAISENHLRKGIANALLCFALSNLKKQGANICFLELRCSNFAAAKLYEKLGFETICIRQKIYSSPCEDGVLMRLTLASFYPKIR